jgi:hypothetical protein
VKLLHRILCAIGFHTEPPGVDPRWSIRWACQSCGEVLDGELAKGKRR